MTGRKKLLVLIVSLSVLPIVPLVFSLGLVDVSQFPLGSLLSAPESGSTPSVFVDPANVVDDSLQYGSYFTIYINISDVTDLYTWHVKISWNKDILNGSQLYYGDFLVGTTSPNGTSAAIVNITRIFNDEGYGWIAESVLGDDAGVGVDGNGTLLEIEFLVVEYGYTFISASVTGTMPTEFIDSTGSSISFTTANGYFDNTLAGDCDKDSGHDVDYDDFMILAGAYGSNSGDPAYDERADFDGPRREGDGDVDYDDFIVLAANYGKSV